MTRFRRQLLGLFTCVADRNPFYLLSAVFMLLGCYILTQAIDPSPEKLDRLVVVLGVMHLYEFILVGLGVFLVNRMSALRDGRMIITIAILFLVDAAYLNSQCVAANPKVGAWISASVFAFAMAKVAALVYFLRLRLTFKHMTFVVAELAALLALPGIFAWMLVYHCAGDGRIPEWTMNLAWWIPGLLLSFYPLIDCSNPDVPIENLRLRVVKSLILVPFVSLLIHMVLAALLYDRPLHTSYLSPILLGTAVFITRIAVIKGKRSGLGLFQVALIVVAVSVSYAPPVSTMKDLEGPLKELLCPLRLACFGGLIAILHLFWAYRRWYLVALSLPLSVATIRVRGGQMGCCSVKQLLRLMERLVPDTGLGWGILAVFMSFLFLIVGVATTIFRKHGPGNRVQEDIPPPQQDTDARGPRNCAVVVLVIGLLALAITPSFVRARDTSQQNACISNLRMIDAGKEQAALELRWESGDVPDIDAVNAYIKGETTPICPGGGTYTYCLIGTNPRCSITRPAKHGLAGS